MLVYRVWLRFKKSIYMHKWLFNDNVLAEGGRTS